MQRRNRHPVIPMDDSDLASRLDRGQTDRPAVGIRVRPDTPGDALAGAILRARRHGHRVIVYTAGSGDGEALAFARELGAEIVEPDHEAQQGTDAGTTDPGRDRFADGRTAVTRAARSAGVPGVIWQADPVKRVDFGASEDALVAGDAYTVDARERAAVPPGSDVTVAIPAHNEAGTISGVVGEAREHADEVVVVCDGCTDETADRAASAGATVIEHGRNRGYGAALKTAFREADRCGAEHLVVLDGDGQHDPEDIPRLLAAQREREAELVVGNRFGPDADTELPAYRRLGLFVVNLATNLSLGVVRPGARVRDTQSGFRAYDRRAIRSLATADDVGDGMGASTDILHHAHSRGFDIEEVGTTVTYNGDGDSTRGPIGHGITLISNILRTIERERPVTVLGLPGFISALVGIGFGYLTFSNYISTGTFPLGLALSAAIFGLAGIFAGFTAIILHSLNQHLN